MIRLLRALRPRADAADHVWPTKKIDILQVADPWARASRAAPSGVELSGLSKANEVQLQQQQKQITELQSSMSKISGNVTELQKQSHRQEERTNQLHVALQETRSSFESTLQKALEEQTAGLMSQLGSLIGRGGTPSGHTKPKEPDPKRAKSLGGVDMDQDEF